MTVLWLFLAAALLVLGQRALYRRFWGKGLQLQLRFDPPAAGAGEAVTLHEELSNRKLLPLPLLLYRYTLLRNFEQQKGKPAFSICRRVALPARRRVRCSLTLHGLRRGIYTIGGGEFQGQDLFYTLTLQKQGFTSPARLTVYPEKLDCPALSVPYRRLLGTVLTRKHTQEDPFELRGIRPYEIYDSMHMINWKATAKTGELKVNQNDFTTDEALCLIIDAEHGSEEARETVISVASTLSQRFLRRGISVSLAANARSCIGGREIRVQAGSSVAHQAVIDEMLAQIKLSTQPSRPLAELLRALGEQRSGALHVLVSAGLPEGDAQEFDQLCRRDGGCCLLLGDQALQARHFSVLPLALDKEAAS